MKIEEEYAQEIKQFWDEFQRFMSGSCNRTWIHGGNIFQIYVRKGTHHFTEKGIMSNCFDIGTIAIGEEHQGKGLGSYLIYAIHEAHHYECTFIESILNNRFLEGLRSMGWKDAHGYEPPCVYLMR